MSSAAATGNPIGAVPFRLGVGATMISGGQPNDWLTKEKGD